jgi:hypothetical protein
MIYPCNEHTLMRNQEMKKTINILYEKIHLGGVCLA